MPTPTKKDATTTHKIPTNFLLNLTQPVQGVDRPSGSQAYAVAIQTKHVPVTT